MRIRNQVCARHGDLSRMKWPYQNRLLKKGSLAAPILREETWGYEQPEPL